VARIQLALNVTDLDAAAAFYTALFGVEPHKRRPGYVNFAVADPPLKLVLFDAAGEPRLNHLGVEMETAAGVATAADRLAAAGLSTDRREGERCCHAVQDKVWVDGPDGRWEVYAVTDDAPDTAPGAGPGTALPQ
jgi:catechol 2,3-dioxygenase-like lactoylglutathione lyase family enzyme